MRKVVTVTGLIALASSTLLADFSYQEKSTLTGGAMLSMLKVAGVFSKGAREAREPIISTVAVKGDKMVHRSNLHTSIIDLNAQTITSIDNQKKTYTVMTFEQMRQMMDQMAQKMHQQKPDDPQMEIKVSSENTGKTQAINGVNAKEVMVRIEMMMNDPKSKQQGSIPITIDTWIGPQVNGYAEISDFYKRMAEKIGWTPGSNMFAGRPDIAKGMSEAYKEVAKLNGTPVYETMTMGGTGQPGAAPPPNTDAQQQEQKKEKPSIGGLFGRGLGVKRGKSSSDDQQQQQSSGSGNPGALLEMNIEFSGFSPAPVDDTQFSIPAGFKQVEAKQP